VNGLLLGLAGAAGSGKDTVADILVRQHGFTKISLADPMKRACAEWFGWDSQTLWGASVLRNEPHARLGGLTARKALQLLGTEFGRACYENVWVDIAVRTARALLSEQCHYDPSEGLIYQPGPHVPSNRVKGVVISDVRFHNEVDAVHAAGGIVWKTQHGTGLQGAAGQHESERHIDSLAVDAVVPRGPLEEVPAVVARLLDMKCGCGSTKNLSFCADPYQSEINGIDEEDWRCESCLHESVQDI
jgi:hypothetical protein